MAEDGMAIGLMILSTVAWILLMRFRFNYFSTRGKRDRA